VINGSFALYGTHVGDGATNSDGKEDGDEEGDCSAEGCAEGCAEGPVGADETEGLEDIDGAVEGDDEATIEGCADNVGTTEGDDDPCVVGRAEADGDTEGNADFDGDMEGATVGKEDGSMVEDCVQSPHSSHASAARTP
jgi:hypothetical protein